MLSLSEEVSWVLQGIVRRWAVFGLVTAFTIFAWVHGQIWHESPTTIWNLFASYWALALETIVGIAMFAQTKRDASVIREIRRIAVHVEEQADLHRDLLSALQVIVNQQTATLAYIEEVVMRLD